jgi:uncharacterized protein YecT (DUF1311 family)
MKIQYKVTAAVMCLIFGSATYANQDKTAGVNEGGQSSQVTDVGLRQSLSSCMDQSDGLTVKMLDCTEVENTFQDKRLNSAYQALQKKLPAKRRSALVKVQRLWISYHDANCKAMIDPEGGTSQSIKTANCYLMSTAQRAQELEDWKTELGN